MEYKKQKLLLEYLISSPETYALCMPILKAEYFDVELRKTASYIHSYYEKYHNLPSPNLITAETNIELKTQQITKDQVEYCINEIEHFCKESALGKAILFAADALQSGDLDKQGEIRSEIETALLTGLHRDAGLTYFDDPSERIMRMLKGQNLIPTGWREIDDALYGGVSRGEIMFISGNSGTGKSLTLGNLALNMVTRGYNCLYITNELAEDIVAQRFDTMLTGIGRAEWQAVKETKRWEPYVKKVNDKLMTAKQHCGNLTIKYMSPNITSANDIRSYLKEFELTHKFIPDVIIIDYLDRVKATERVSADNTFEKDRIVTIETRSIGMDYNTAIITASQLNRESVNAVQHHEGHIAGGISKFNESDIWISIAGKMYDKGEAVYSFLKTRNSDGVNKKVRLEYDSKYLRIRDPKQKDAIHFTPKHKPAPLDATRNVAALMTK